jgi:hypothetical protein
VAAAGQLRARPAVALVDDAQLERVVAPRDRDARGRAAGVLDRVGECLLHDPVDRELGARRERLPRALHRERHGQAGRARALDQLAEAVERRRRLGLRGRVEDAEQDVHLGQRVGPGVADARRRVLGARGIGRQDPAGAARLHDHDADAVRDYVVHLAGDPAALVGHRLLGLALALLGGQRGRLVQLGGVPQAQVHRAPREPAQRHQDRGEVGVAGGGVRARQPHRGDRHEQDGEHDAPVARRRVAAPAVRDHQQRDEGGHEIRRVGHPERRGKRERDERDRHRQRVAAPPQQQQAHPRDGHHDHPARAVEVLQRERLGHGGHEHGGGQRDVDRLRREAAPPHATRSSGRRTRTA